MHICICASSLTFGQASLCAKTTNSTSTFPGLLFGEIFDLLFHCRCLSFKCSIEWRAYENCRQTVWLVRTLCTCSPGKCVPAVNIDVAVCYTCRIVIFTPCLLHAYILAFLPTFFTQVIAKWPKLRRLKHLKHLFRALRFLALHMVEIIFTKPTV